MIKDKDKTQFKNILTGRRDEIFQQIQQAMESEQELSSPEIEPEETAKKEKIFLEKERLEALDRQEIEDIDWAFHKLETGSFGTCESCGREISSDRLVAIPWTRYCKRCAQAQENDKTTPSDVVREGSSTSDFEGLSDEELTDAMQEEIRYDGRVKMDEIEISCKDGVVYLDGYISGEFERQILMDILENNMGLEKIEDHLVSEPLFWEREDRSPGKYQPEKEDEEILFQGEDEEDSDEEGLSVIPSDEWMPENED